MIIGESLGSLAFVGAGGILETLLGSALYLAILSVSVLAGSYTIVRGLAIVMHTVVTGELAEPS
jgi:hypothetical protein